MHTLPTDTLHLDGNEFTLEEAEILNMEVTPEIEELLLQLKKEKEEVPEVLFDDDPVPLSEEPDYEATLNRVLDFEDDILKRINRLQERMNNGMALIQKSNQQISVFFEKHRFMGKVYKAWRGDLSPQENKWFTELPANKIFIKWFDYRDKLWNTWHALKEEKLSLYTQLQEGRAKIVGSQTVVWKMLSDLLENPVTMSDYLDPEYIDEQISIDSVDSRSNPCVIETQSGASLLRRDWKQTSHTRLEDEYNGFMEEMREYTRKNYSKNAGNLYNRYQWLLNQGLIRNKNQDTLLDNDTYIPSDLIEEDQGYLEYLQNQEELLV